MHASMITYTPHMTMNAHVTIYTLIHLCRLLWQCMPLWPCLFSFTSVGANDHVCPCDHACPHISLYPLGPWVLHVPLFTLVCPHLGLYALGTMSTPCALVYPSMSECICPCNHVSHRIPYMPLWPCIPHISTYTRYTSVAMCAAIFPVAMSTLFA